MDINEEIKRIYELIEIRAGDVMNKNSFKYCLLLPSARVLQYASESLLEGKEYEDYDEHRVKRHYTSLVEHIKLLEDNNWRITDVD